LAQAERILVSMWGVEGPGSHRGPLLAWPTGAHDAARLTARKLFDALDTDGDGLLSVDEVLRSWPVEDCAHRRKAAGLEGALVRLADQSRCEGKIAWLQFRAMVRLWHVTGGDVCELRPFLLQNAIETYASATLGLAAMQVSALVSAPPKLSAVGGIGAAVAAMLFDGGSVRPVLQPSKVDMNMPVTPFARRTLFAVASASIGLFLAPAVPLIAGTMGDERGHGYGPSAVVGLATAQLGGQAAFLAAMPAQWLHAKSLIVAPATALLGGGFAATLLGAVAAHFSGRGRRTAVPLLAAAGALSVHSALVTAVAVHGYERGKPEPLRAALSPVVELLAHARLVLLPPGVDDDMGV